MTPLLGRIYPKGVSGRQGHFTRQVALYWRYFFPRRRPLHGFSYPWVSGSSAGVPLLLCHSTLATPCLATPYLGDALLGDALPWRRFLLATLPLGDACTWRHPHLGDALR